MRRCIQLAEEAQAAGGSPYGALIADPTRGIIVVEGSNHAAHNPIWHGEMAAINNLSQVLPPNKSVYSVASGLELYTTAEPCSMCMSAISWSGFGRVIYGTSIPYIASQGLNQIEIRATDVAKATSFHNISVIGGVLSNVTNQLYKSCGDKCAAQHRDHVHSH